MFCSLNGLFAARHFLRHSLPSRGCLVARLCSVDLEPLGGTDLLNGDALEVVIGEELPDELAELFCEYGVEARGALIGFHQGLPVAFFVVLVDVLIQRVLLSCLCEEGHDACHHQKDDNAHCEDVCSVPFVRLAFMDLWCHVSLSASMSVKHADDAALSESLREREIANLEIEIRIDQNVLEFQISVHYSLFQVQILKCREKLGSVMSGDVLS